MESSDRVLGLSVANQIYFLAYAYEGEKNAMHLHVGLTEAPELNLAVIAGVDCGNLLGPIVQDNPVGAILVVGA